MMYTMTHGYRLQLLHRPPVMTSILLMPVSDPQRTAVLHAEILTLLQNGAIQQVPARDQQAGFHSCYFLIPKWDGGLCPILDLWRLNKYLCPLCCRMLTILRLRAAVVPKDRFVMADLKDS